MVVLIRLKRVCDQASERDVFHFLVEPKSRSKGRYKAILNTPGTTVSVHMTSRLFSHSRYVA